MGADPSKTRGFPTMQITIAEITDGFAYGKDRFGRDIKIPISTQRAKGTTPLVGETWIISKDLGSWTFAAILNDTFTVTPQFMTGPIVAVAGVGEDCPWAEYKCDGVNDEEIILAAITAATTGVYGSFGRVLLVGLFFGTGGAIDISAITNPVTLVGFAPLSTEDLSLTALVNSTFVSSAAVTALSLDHVGITGLTVTGASVQCFWNGGVCSTVDFSGMPSDATILALVENESLMQGTGAGNGVLLPSSATGGCDFLALNTSGVSIDLTTSTTVVSVYVENATVALGASGGAPNVEIDAKDSSVDMSHCDVDVAGSITSEDSTWTLAASFTESVAGGDVIGSSFTGGGFDGGADPYGGSITFLSKGTSYHSYSSVNYVARGNQRSIIDNQFARQVNAGIDNGFVRWGDGETAWVFLDATTTGIVCINNVFFGGVTGLQDNGTGNVNTPNYYPGSGGAPLDGGTVAVADQYTSCPWAKYQCNGSNDETQILAAINDVQSGSYLNEATVLLIGRNFGTGGNIAMPDYNNTNLSIVGISGGRDPGGSSDACVVVDSTFDFTANGAGDNNLALENLAGSTILIGWGDNPYRNTGLCFTGCEGMTVDSGATTWNSQGTITSIDSDVTVTNTSGADSHGLVISVDGGSMKLSSPSLGSVVARDAWIGFLTNIKGGTPGTNIGESTGGNSYLSLSNCDLYFEESVEATSVSITNCSVYVNTATVGSQSIILVGASAAATALCWITHNSFIPCTGTVAIPWDQSGAPPNIPPDGSLSLFGPVITIYYSTPGTVIANVFFGGAAGMILDSGGASTITPNWP